MILRWLGYIFVYAIVIITMIIDYPIILDQFGYATAAMILLAPFIIYLTAYNRAAYWVTIRNVYVVAAWISSSLLLYLFTKYGILNGLTGALIYTMFILVAIGIVGLLNTDKAKYVVLQHEPIEFESFARGITYGFISFAAAMAMLRLAIAAVDPRVMLIGPVTSQLAEAGIGAEFLIILFLVAVPEELMARVFYFKFGSAVLDPITASILVAVTGYSFHAVTRYGIPEASIVLLILTAVWIILTVSYVRHGLLGAVAAHATYNTLISALELGYSVFAAAVLIFSIPLAYLIAKKRTIF